MNGIGMPPEPRIHLDDNPSEYLKGFREGELIMHEKWEKWVEINVEPLSF